MNSMSKVWILLMTGAIGLFAQAPEINPGGVVNAASLSANPPLAPGGLISIFGKNLTSGTAIATSIPLPRILNGVTVMVAGFEVPILGVFKYSDDTQINGQLPWNVPIGPVKLVVIRDGISSAPYDLTVGKVSPGIFSVVSGLGRQAVAINADGSLTAPVGSIPGLATRPAELGEAISIYATGMGPVTPAIRDGADSLDVSRQTLDTPAVTLGSLAANVQFAGLAPQYVGVNQINVTVPSESTGGPRIPLGLGIGGVASNNETTIAISGLRRKAMIPESDSTVAHVVISEAGLEDKKRNAWVSFNAPPTFPVATSRSASTPMRKVVSGFSDSDYVTLGSVSDSIVNFPGSFTACFSFSINSLTNSPIIFSNFDPRSGGWLVQLVNGGGAYLIANGFDGPLTPNKVGGGLQILCVGVSGSDSAIGYVKLNGGPVVEKKISYAKAKSAVATFGRFGGSPGYGFDGSLEEAWFSSDKPSVAGLDAIYRKAVSEPGTGPRFADTNGTVLHLLGAEFDGVKWRSTQTELFTIGRLRLSAMDVACPSEDLCRQGVTPAGTATGRGDTSSFFFLPEGQNVLDFANDFSACVVAKPSKADIAGTAIYASSGVSQGAPGWQLVNETGATRFFGETGSVVDVSAIPDRLNVICFGRLGQTLVLKVNDRKMVSAGGGGRLTKSGGIGRLGMHWDFLIGFSGTLFEAWFSDEPPTENLFESVVSQVLAVL